MLSWFNGGRLCKLPNDGLFVYLRHASNSWSFPCGRYLDPRGWERVAEPPLPLDDRAFYAALSPAVPSPGTSLWGEPKATAPLVSCIMPTRDRQAFVLQSVSYFQRQDYPARELIIVDDGREDLAGQLPDDPRVRYLRIPPGLSLGAKHNRACREATGDLIAHWDDDWMAPHRFSYQVERLLRQQAEVCGLRSMLFYDMTTGQTWLYDYPVRERPWLVGGSLLYTRDFWRRSPFPDIQVGEDTRFLWNRRMARAVALPEYNFYVAMIHPKNTSRKVCHGPYWSPWAGDMQRIMGDDLDFYQLLRRISRSFSPSRGHSGGATCSQVI